MGPTAFLVYIALRAGPATCDELVQLTQCTKKSVLPAIKALREVQLIEPAGIRDRGRPGVKPLTWARALIPLEDLPTIITKMREHGK